MTRTLDTAPWLEQAAAWPQQGRQILAQHDERGIVVYQAYSDEIGRWAAEHGRFGGPWSFARGTWIKPNFLWMQYRSGWGAKPNQTTTLAIRLRWEGFREILRAAVHTSYQPGVYATQAAWRQALKGSPIRVQWDPDHEPTGRPTARRALQLGLVGEWQRRFASEWIVSIEDVSPFVAEQRACVRAGEWARLVTPRETIVRLDEPELERRLQISPG